MVANTGMLTLNRDEVIAYVGANASQHGLDPAAVLAVANHEGLNRPPVNGQGQTWILPNEGGLSNFGPPSWFQGGAGKQIVQQQGSLQTAATWAWTPAGIDYWLNEVANSKTSSGVSPQGRTGFDAISAIVHAFERPREDLAGGEITNAWNDYKTFQQQLQIPMPGGITVPPIPMPGQPRIPGQFPTPNNPQIPASPTVGTPFSMHILDLPTGPVNLTLPWDFSGILLFLAAIFCIIIGALLWDKSRNVIIRGGETAAMAA